MEAPPYACTPEDAPSADTVGWTCPPPITRDPHVQLEPDLPALPHWEYNTKRRATYLFGSPNSQHAGQLVEEQCRPLQAEDAPECAELMKQEACKAKAKCAWDIVYKDDLSGIPLTLVPLIRTFKVNVLHDVGCTKLTTAEACNGAACYWKKRRGFSDECMTLEKACREENAKKDLTGKMEKAFAGLGTAFQKDLGNLVKRCNLDDSLIREQRAKRYAVVGATLAAAALAAAATTSAVSTVAGTVYNTGAWIKRKLGGNAVVDQAAAAVGAGVTDKLKTHGKEAAMKLAVQAGVPGPVAQLMVDQAAAAMDTGVKPGMATGVTPGMATGVGTGMGTGVPDTETYANPVQVLVENARLPTDMPPATSFGT
jgi:hypothetical protein